MDDRLCNCQFDLAGSIISRNKDKRHWKRGKYILAKEQVLKRRKTVTLNALYVISVI